MTAWFEALPIAERVFFFLAAPATVIMLVQTALLFFGTDGEPGDTNLDSDTSGIGEHSFAQPEIELDTEFDIDPAGTHSGNTDSNGLRFLTTRGIIAFLTVAGWTGALCVEMNFPTPLAVIIAAVFGFGAMVGIAVLVRSLMGLQASGNINYRNALGTLAEVYLTIPADGGMGKVSLALDGSLSEYEAVTESGITLRTGSTVRVTDIVRGYILVVEPLEDSPQALNEHKLQ